MRHCATASEAPASGHITVAVPVANRVNFKAGILQADGIAALVLISGGKCDEIFS
jgi:hypothetical protein